ncbi:MAG: YabP/YqfC family sporulation protein [Clostridia bacterium]|nr:YabP/YqfC family sporulation protein [Clostridia bacterium]
MRLYDEIFKRTDGELFPAARCLIVPNGGGYFEGVKAMGDFSPERVELYFRGEVVRVDGESLSVKKYCDGDLELGGKITALTVLNGER